ncbi:MAG: hypothetical protein ACUVRM_07955 [Bacillota bacterium]
MMANFTKYDSLRFETSSVFFEGFADRELEVNIKIPADLAALKYDLRFYIYSTMPNSLAWIKDLGEPISVTGNGWQTFRYRWRGKPVAGNLDCIRGFGVCLTRPPGAPTWKGNLYFDDIRW